MQNRHNKKKLRGLFFWIVSFFLLFGGQVGAYEKERYDDKVEDRFLVSPSRLELQLEPGQQITDSFQVVNRLGRRQDFEVVVEDLTKSGEQNGANSAKEWIKPEIFQFSLEHGERITMNFTINVPEKIPSGGYYASLLVVAENSGEGDANLKLVNRVGVSLLASVPGEITEQGELIFFKTKKKFFWRGPVEFFSFFENQSNIHLNPKGEISVFNFLGGKVAQMPLAEATVLPGTGKEWKTTWNRKWLWGRYSAVSKIYYGRENKILIKNTSFWAFPLDVLLLAAFLLYLVHKVLKKWQDNFEVRKKIKTEK